MRRSHFSLLTAMAVFFCAQAARAADGPLLALNLPETAPVTRVVAELKEPATAQAKAQVTPAGYTDFDAFSSVNDPLYRAGAREMLKQELKRGESVVPAQPAKAASPAKPALRDAPVSKGLKRLKIRKPVHTDPVKTKHAL